MKKPLVNDKIFEYIDEHSDLLSPSDPNTKFYKKDINENQYPNLDGPINPIKTEFNDPQEAAEIVREFAVDAGADLVGFTQVKDFFVFQNIELTHSYAVVLAMEMDYERIKTSPETLSKLEVFRVYWRLGEVVVKVADFIRSLGYPAKAHHPRSFERELLTILYPVAAIEAGLGEVGRTGLLITEEFGPRVRIGTVTTELELPQSPKKNFGVEEYCSNCHLCQDVCEGDAIPDNKKQVRGILKYTIDPFKCLPYFVKHDGCNLCVAKCAFNLKPEDLKQFVSELKTNK